MKKIFITILALVLILKPTIVDASQPYLIKEWTRNEGETYDDAIDWTNYLELDDGYIIASLGGNGYASLKKISKDGKITFWSKNVDRGLYFGDMHYYKNHLYITSWDGVDGTSLLQMDSEGNQLKKIIITPEVDNDYAYAGESFLRGNILYFVYKSYEDSGMSDFGCAPEFIAEINLDTLKVENSLENFYDYTDEELNYITGGKTELISERMSHIYHKEGYDTYMSQEIITDKYKYYCGYLYNEITEESIGIVVKADFNNNIIWKYEPGAEVSAEFYDMAYIGNDMIAVGGYTYDYTQQEYISSYINVMNGNGKIVERHNIKEELGGVVNGDLIVLNNIKNGLLGQVVAYDYDTDTYQLYTIKYSTPQFDIEKEVKGEGKISVIPNAMEGEEVEFNIEPETNYTTKSIVIYDEAGNKIPYNGNKFIMPKGNVKIVAEFVKVNNPNTSNNLYIIMALTTIILVPALLIKKKTTS